MVAAGAVAVLGLVVGAVALQDDLATLHGGQ